VINTYIKKELRSQTCNLTLYHKELEKEYSPKQKEENKNKRRNE